MPETSSSERFDRIEKKLDDLSTSVGARFEQVATRFAAVDRRFAEIREEYRKEFREVQEHFVEQRQYTELAYERLDRRMTEGFSRLERKLDQVIDAQSRPRVTTPPRPRPSKRRR
jgi:hypothetical protein